MQKQKTVTAVNAKVGLWLLLIGVIFFSLFLHGLNKAQEQGEKTRKAERAGVVATEIAWQLRSGEISKGSTAVDLVEKLHAEVRMAGWMLSSVGFTEEQLDKSVTAAWSREAENELGGLLGTHGDPRAAKLLRDEFAVAIANSGAPALVKKRGIGIADAEVSRNVREWGALHPGPRAADEADKNKKKQN